MPIVRSVPLAVLLLAGCAAADPAPAPPAAHARAGLVPDGPFRARIESAYSSLDPEGTLTCSFEAVLESADGSEFPRGRWYFEDARLAEQPLLTAKDEGWQEDFGVGRGFGWTQKGLVLLQGLPADTRRIRRLVIDLPMLEILEGVSEELRLPEGTDVVRTIGCHAFEFEAADGGLSQFTYDSDGNLDEDEERNGLPLDGFYGSGSRPIEHAWEITDARGRPFVQGAGAGFGVFVGSPGTELEFAL